MQLFPSRDETIAGVSHALKRRERTCVEVLERCLGRIDAWEGKLHAWVSVDREGALDAARSLDLELSHGSWRGALHGIPIAIKDLIDVFGRPTAAGAPWLAHSPAGEDAMLVTRLRAAGAIILGKTVTTQFGCFDPPATRNPWNLERTPGGSSSGSAAAVASGMCLGAVGTQTGGSITRPASFCGVAGCKPSFGLVPLKGVYPAAHSLDHAGPIARSVEDLAILLEAMVSPMQQMAWRGASALEGSSLIELAVACAGPEAPFSPFPPAGKVRLGRLRGMFEARADKAALAVFEGALDRLTGAGGTIIEVSLPAEFDDVLRCHRVVMTFELAVHHGAMPPEHAGEYLPIVRGLIDEGKKISSEEYMRAKRHQERLRGRMAEVMRELDALVCPATLGAAPTPETTGDPAFNSPWSYTGLPTVSFPIGLLPEELPLSMQLVGCHSDEPTLFAAAQWCEQTLRV